MSAAPVSDPLAGMTCLVEVVQRLSMARDMATVQEIVRRSARKLAGADGATFVLKDGDKCHYVDEDAISPLWKGQKFPLSACVSGWVMANHQAVVIEDIYADSRVPHSTYRPTFVKSLVIVPIRTLDPIGAIGTYWARHHRPGDLEVKLLQALADSTSVAIENVQLICELEERVKARTAELERRNRELLAAHQLADRVFAAYAKALPGTTLDGKYRLDEQLGSGGFGVVFRGHHLPLDRPVAIKVFRPGTGNDSARELQRFLREGATTARLTHPNAVRVLDSGVSDEGVAYLVMELLHGRTLAREISTTGPLPLKRAVGIAATVADVLASAHQQGVLHRDIKPDNVFLHRDGEDEVVKVVDFGIATALGRHQAPETDRLTQTGHYVGTPAFVAPERVAGAEDDGRSDVFSLGSVLYEMLCGVLPWTKDQQREFVTKKGRHIPPRSLRDFRPEVPPELESLVNRTLSWDAGQRPTARELARALAELAERLPQTTALAGVRAGQLMNPNATGEYLPGTGDDEFWMTGLR
jgi:hypothetical protein